MRATHILFSLWFAFREAVDLLREAASESIMSETWLDLLAIHWKNIQKDEQMMSFMPEILSSLSESIVSENYLMKLKSLMDLSESEALSSVDFSLLENAFNQASHNIRRLQRFSLWDLDLSMIKLWRLKQT